MRQKPTETDLERVLPWVFGLLFLALVAFQAFCF